MENKKEKKINNKKIKNTRIKALLLLNKTINLQN